MFLWSKRLSGIAVLAAMVVVGAAADPSYGQADARDSVGVESADRQTLARLIRDRIEALDALDRQAATDAEALARDLEYARQKTTELEQQVGKLDEANADLEAEIASLGDQVEQLKSEAAKHARQLEVMEQAAKSVAQRVEARIDAGIPFRKAERSQAAGAVLEQLRSDDAVTRARALAELWVVLGDQLRLAKSRSLWNEPVLLEDGARRVQAHQLRLGLVQQLFVSEDGGVAGHAGAGSGGWISASDDAEAMAAIRQAMDVVREQAPPTVAPVPLVLRPGDGEGP